MTATLFIDANQYLNLYRLVAGRRLLDSLEEQREHIFVAEQLVDEVARNKLRCAQTFLADTFNKIQPITAPDHLLGVSDAKITELRKLADQVRDAKAELIKLAAETLERISNSEDDVSKRLAVLFANAAKPSAEELANARARKELGNPPGKPGDPLGDQISWEQLLGFCKSHAVTKFWLITSDQDYSLKYEKRYYLNPALLRELKQARGSTLEVYCFGDLLDGLKHFAANAGVKAEKLPSDQEAADIKKELDSLPPFAWYSPDNTAWAAIHGQNLARQRYIAALSGGGGFIGTSGVPEAGTAPFGFGSQPEE
jgi:hypothetical protein